MDVAWCVRLARPEDAPHVVAVVRAVYDEYGFLWEECGYHQDLYHLDSHYLARGWPFWVAEEQSGAVVGTAALELFAPVPGADGEVVLCQGQRRIGGSDCALERLYVLPRVRRRGVGRALFEASLTAARHRGAKQMEIWSDKAFRSAHALYASYGARRVGDRLCHDPEQSPEWGMLLQL